MRTAGIFASLVLIPPVVYAGDEPPICPNGLISSAPKNRGGVWLCGFSFFLLEVGLDLIRMALIHTPRCSGDLLRFGGCGPARRICGGRGLFTPETILYTAVTAVCGFATPPSIEFSFAIRLFRYLLFFGTVVAGWWV